MQPPLPAVPSRLGQENPASTEIRCTRQPKTCFNSSENALYLLFMPNQSEEIIVDQQLITLVQNSVAHQRW